MQTAKSKQKRSSSLKTTHFQKDKMQLPKQIRGYGVRSNISKKQEKNNNKKTGKVSRERMNTNNYDFPEFAISFRPSTPHKDKVSESGVNSNKKVHRKVLGSSNRNIKKKGQKLIVKEENKNQGVKENIICQDECKKRVEGGGSVDWEFKGAIQKIFQLLDIFNRGKISETNINKWIPQSVLYFLGSAFQHIKTNRLTLNLQQFSQLCQPFLHQSNPQDIQQFIKEARMASNLKCSVNTPEQTLGGEMAMSPIRRRMVAEQQQRSIKQSGSIVKNKHLETVLSVIKNRQVEVTNRIKQLKDKRKSVTFHHALEELSANQLQETTKCRQEGTSVIKSKIYDLYSPDRGEPRSILRTSGKYTDESFVKGLQDSKSNIQNTFQDASNPAVANFTFQLPQPTRIYLPQPHAPHIEDVFKVKMNSSQTYQKSHSLKLLNKSMRNDPKSVTYRENEKDDERLDRLHNKIEQYMRRNAQKLQKSRSLYSESKVFHD